MKLLSLLLMIVVAVTTIAWLTQKDLSSKAKPASTSSAKVNAKARMAISEKMEEKAKAARSFVKQKGFNDQVCFLIDMSFASGKNRFFVYDLKKDSILYSGLVAHGNCFEYWLEGRRYSNVVGSGCTSLGRYKIGTSYTGKFGYSYKLHGLDTSNSNALERTVVLHSHSCVPAGEINDEICQSNGCPTVSPNMLVDLKRIINQSKKPVLLWIYN